MRTTLTRLFTVMMLIMVSMGAMADVKVLFGEKGDDKFKTDGDKIEATYDGGTIVVTQKVVDATKVTVFLTVTPNKGYTMQEKNVIEAYATAPANIGTTRAPLVSEKLTLDCEDFKDEYSTRTYYVDIDPKLALWVKSTTFEQNKRDGAKGTAEDYTFYVINNNGKESVYAKATVETSLTVLAAFKATTTNIVSPFIADDSYYFYDTEDAAIAATGLTSGGGNGSSTVATIDAGGDKKIYVRYFYDASSSPINLNGDVEYNIMVGGRYLAHNVNRNRPETRESGYVTKEKLRSFEPTDTKYIYLWKLTGNDPYNIALTGCYAPGDRFLWGQWGSNGSARNMYVNNGVNVNEQGSNNPLLGTTIESTNLHFNGTNRFLASFILLPHSSETGYVLMAATTSNQPKNNQYAYQTCSTSSGSGYDNPYVRFSAAASAEVVSLTEALPCKKTTFSYNFSNYEVTIESVTYGATIYYTLTGADPVVPEAGNDPVFPTQLYDPSSKPTVNSRTVVKAVAVKSGKENSDVASTTIVTNPVITLAEGPFTYSGSAIEPSVSSVKDGETVIDPSEYTVSYSDNVNVGSSATVNITANEGGSYILKGSATFTIDQMSIGSGAEPVSGINISVSKSGGNYLVTVKHGETTLAEGTDYTWTGGPEVIVTGMGNYTGTAKATYVPVTPGYYALHQNGAGYLKVNGEGVNLSNDETFRYSNVFDSNGNSIWYLSSDGYLQNEYFYLNVANNKTLYLDVNPVTRWSTEEIAGDAHGKQRIKINDGIQDLYICYDSSSKVIKLKSGTTNIYNACPITITEISWTSTPTAAGLTLQSPQLITYLRASFKQNISYELYNDNGTKVAEQKKDRTVYGTLTYASGGDGKGTNWDIDASGVLYNKKASGDAEFTATYNILPADPVVRAAHSAAANISIKYKVTQKPFTLTDNMDYLLYSISGGDNYRYPYDDGITDGNPVKPNGRGGRDTSNPSVLTDPLSDGTGRNPQISWKITADAEGFYTFQNKSTKKYLYYDETPHASSDYGTLCVGSAPSGNSAKFRLYKAANDANYGTCYYIIPYSKIFAVYKSDGLANGLNTTLNIKDYTGGTPVISLSKPNGNSTWCIYKYEAEYRIREDFSITGPSTAETIGNYQFTSDGWYGKYIKESPKTGSAQRGLVINGTYNENDIDFQWTVSSLGNYINITDGTNTDGTWTKTTTGNANNRQLVVSVTSLPVSSTSGVIKLKLSGHSAPNTNIKTSSEKTFAFTILGDGAISFTDITSLAGITSSSGAYRLVGGNGSNFAYSATNKPGVTSFSGVLDGNNQTISGLNAPLFDNLSNGTVRNVNLSGVGISNHSGPTGAIAGTADGGSRIYNVGILDGEVGSNGDVCGGLVGKLDGSARVINCFSYANITGGSTVGGIVGNNCYASKSNDIRTMVMNCMFYGNITATGDKAPVYNGSSIDNFWTNDTNQGLNNYNYFRFDQPYVSSINHYNCALGAEDRYLDRFEFFRHTLNSNRELAAWYITGNADDGKGENNIMAKWVLEPSQIGTDTPYPILKPQDTYPSVVNHDAANAVDIGDEKVNHNKGRKFGTLTVNISLGTGYPIGAALREGKSSPTLNITDKDTEHYDFNYRKVQLPYYNEVGTGNYTHNKVVTGWKITRFTGGTPGSFTEGIDAPAYNFVDRKCTNKDLYGTDGSNRVFSQGAYYEVPDGVTAIDIEPYWADCVYLADATLDVTYSTGYAEKQSTTAHYINGSSYPINGDNQVVYTDFDKARAALAPSSSNIVYDKAIVLVGNYHRDFGSSAPGGNSVYPMTIMSADLNFDNEPDYCLFYAHSQRQNTTPIRFDFINLPAISMTLKPSGATAYKQAGIFKPKGWFEITNTALIRLGQFEYGQSSIKTTSAPLILMGGIIEQIVSTETTGSSEAGNTPYIHVGGNVWFNEFNNGCHTNASLKTPKTPISVSGGDYNKFYLSGIYTPDAPYDKENAECYIDGGRFGEVAGAGMQLIDGDVTWFINGADIKAFYGGGINPTKSITGNINTTITNSWVTNFYGGPKFGDMATGKTVITSATDCHFGNYFGAGYGGNAYNRVGTKDATHNNTNNVSAGTWNGYITSDYGRAYNSGQSGISTSFEYEYLIHSNGSSKVARFYVNYASLSLASTHNVTSTLTGCVISHNFYGGGSLGSVNGDVTSTLTNCTVEGSVFGAGFSATTPTIDVMNKSNFVVAPSYDYNAGVFNDGQVKYPATVKYTWTNNHGSTSSPFTDDEVTGEHWIYTATQLSDLGRVTGTVKLNIEGNTLIKGYELDDEGEITTKQTGGVFGGGDASGVTGSTEVTANASGQKTEGYNVHNVYGGGNSAPVSGNTVVTIKGNTVVNDNVYGGGNEGPVTGSTTVNIEQ